MGKSKKTGARMPIGLKCSVCGNRRRHTEKNTKETPDKLEIKKYCSNCKKQQVFVEAKIGK